MSYQVLARKYRPSNFHETVGQDHVLKALINALDNQRLHHAYLFTGTRGVGKTTIARILAKCLNCEQGVTSQPCGTCGACTSIAEGRFVDMIEVDAASRTKVEDTRELLENIQYAPTAGRYKVYIIDEVHMLSTSSFNALLKTLEEPPEHVKFLLATTDPQKLPITVLSRCLQFALKNMTPEGIVGQLEHVLAAEQIEYEVDALWSIARSADGSMRDALSLTDQAVAFGQGTLIANDVNSMLGTLDRQYIVAMVQALADDNAQQLLQLINQVSEQGPNYEHLLESLANTLHQIAILQVVPDWELSGESSREELTALAHRLTAEQVQLYYQIATNSRSELRLAPDPRSGVEMALLRMVAFKPQGVINIDVAPDPSVKKPEPRAEGPLGESAPAKPAPEVVSDETEPSLDTTSLEQHVSVVEAEGVSSSVETIEEAPPWNDGPMYDDTNDQQRDVSATDSPLSSAPNQESHYTVDEPSEPNEPNEPNELTPSLVLEETSASESVSEPAVAEAPEISPQVSLQPEESSLDTSTKQAPTQALKDVLAQEPQRDGADGNVEAAPEVKKRELASPAMTWSIDDLSEENFPSFALSLKMTGPAGSALRHMSLTSIDAGVIACVMDEAQAPILKNRQQEQLEQVMSKVLNQSVNLKITIGEPTQHTAANLSLAIERRRRHEATEALLADTNVQSMMQQFDAQLKEHTVKSLSPEEFE